LVDQSRPFWFSAKETGGSSIFPPNPDTALPDSPTTGGRAHQTFRHVGLLSEADTLVENSEKTLEGRT